jgi:hypothetical protein
MSYLLDIAELNKKLQPNVAEKLENFADTFAKEEEFIAALDTIKSRKNGIRSSKIAVK